MPNHSGNENVATGLRGDSICTDRDTAMVKIEKVEIVNDSMCTDTATDSGTETFILIGPCSDLCRTVRVNGWVCLSFWSLLVPFLAILSCPWKSPCDPAMPEISKITKDETEQLIALV